MNIGIFTDCYHPTKNGVVTSIVQLKEGLERRGHKVIIFTVKSPHYKETDPTVYGFPSIPFNSSIEIRLGFINQKTINQIVQHEQLDLLHSHTEFSLGWAAKRAARKLNLPLIHTAHTMYVDYRHYLFLGKLVSAKMVQRWFKWFLCHYNVLICPSRKAQKYFLSFLPSLSTIVIGNGICQTRFQSGRLTYAAQKDIREALGIQTSDRVILYVGRMAQEKRVAELLNVLTPLLRQHPDYKALFVGDGPSYRHLTKELSTRAVQKQVIFTGYVHWEQIYTMYGIADIFVTASLSENHPMTLIEAAMCGLPVVARRDESYLDLIKDGHNGYLVESDFQIAERVAELLRDETKRLTFSQHAHNVSEQFTSEIHVNQCEALYHHMLKNRTH